MKPEKMYDYLDGEWVMNNGHGAVIAYRIYSTSYQYGQEEIGRVLRCGSKLRSSLPYLAQQSEVYCSTLETAQRMEDQWARDLGVLGKSAKDRWVWGEE